MALTGEKNNILIASLGEGDFIVMSTVGKNQLALQE